MMPNILLKNIRETKTEIIFIEANSLQEYERNYRNRIEKEIAADTCLVLISPEDIDLKKLKNSRINLVLKAPLSKVYVTFFILTQTKQADSAWERPSITEEKERIEVVDRVKKILEKETIRKRIDRYLQLAKQLITKGNEQDVAVSLNLITGVEQETMLSSNQTHIGKVPRDVAFCSFVVMEKDNIYTSDTLQDERFQYNPYVINAPHIRSYYGAKLEVEGEVIGAFCCYSASHIELTESQRKAFNDLTGFVIRMLEAYLSKENNSGRSLVGFLK